MSFAGLLNNTMTIARETGFDTNEIGEQVGTWSQVQADIPCRIQQTSVDERTDDSRAGVVLARLWFPSGTDIRKTDRIVDADGFTWEVIGVNTDVGAAGHHGAAELMRVE